LNDEDLTDLALLRLDVMVPFRSGGRRSWKRVLCHLLPDNREKKVWRLTLPQAYQLLELDFYSWIQASKMNFSAARGHCHKRERKGQSSQRQSGKPSDP